MIILGVLLWLVITVIGLLLIAPLLDRVTNQRIWYERPAKPVELPMARWRHPHKHPYLEANPDGSL